VNSWSEGTVVASDTVSFSVTQTGLEQGPGPYPVLAVSPNPFTSRLVLSFETVQSGHSSVLVFDLTGRLVRTLQRGELAAGSQSLSWDGTDDSGNRLPSGIYTLLVSTLGGTVTKPVCVLR
jgi:hypothetical protein